MAAVHTHKQLIARYHRQLATNQMPLNIPADYIYDAITTHYYCTWLAVSTWPAVSRWPAYIYDRPCLYMTGCVSIWPAECVPCCTLVQCQIVPSECASCTARLSPARLPPNYWMSPAYNTLTYSTWRQEIHNLRQTWTVPSPSATVTSSAVNNSSYFFDNFSKTYNSVLQKLLSTFNKRRRHQLHTAADSAVEHLTSLANYAVTISAALFAVSLSLHVCCQLLKVICNSFWQNWWKSSF